MKRIILFIASLILLMTACNKTEPAPIPEQYGQYIFFSQGVETKASLIGQTSDLNGKSFGVVGFKYPSTTTWNDYKQTTPVPMPNVFYGTDSNIVSVEEVTCSSDGVGSYAPLQGWSNTKKYTFFAYYPYSVALVNAASGSTSYTGGTPAIKYSVALDNPETEVNEFKESMVDLMTATAVQDKYWKSASDNNITVDGKTDIKFSFQHRLSAIGLSVKNQSTSTITVTGVTFTIGGLKYSDIIIPLEEVGTVIRTEQSITQQTTALDLPDGGHSFVTSTSYDEIADKLILIPQGDAVTLSVTINYTRTLDGYKPLQKSETIGGLSTGLTEGNKHMVQVYINDYMIGANVTCQGWVQIPVEDSFN